MSSLSYSASGATKAGVTSASALALAHGSTGRTGVSFATDPMQEDTEITGPIVLVIWVSSTSEDMDIMVTLRNIGPDGKDLFEIGQHGQPVALTMGWLRASHRKLDPDRSLPYRPFHAHDERRWLKPNEPVECQVEIWPTSIVLKKGNRLRLDIQPRDGFERGALHPLSRGLQRRRGEHDLCRGDMASYLMLPVIPEKVG